MTTIYLFVNSLLNNLKKVAIYEEEIIPVPLVINDCTSNWLEKAGNNGTLHCKNGSSGIWTGCVPEGWTIVDDK